MPTYGYSCLEPTCLHTFDIRHGINEPAKTTCPKCGKETLQRGVGGGCGVLWPSGKPTETFFPKGRQRS